MTSYDAFVLACFACVLALATYGDIDGDGHADSVTLTRHATFFVLRVDTGDRVIQKRLRGFSGPQASGQGDPRIIALRQINGERGLEVVVRVWQGAANDFLIVYTVMHNRLVAISGGPHDPADAPYVWDIGGTVGTGSSNADCIGRGRIAVIVQWTHRGVWHYRLTTYAVSATRFTKRRVYELASAKPVQHLPSDWPRVRRLEFASCAGRAVSQ